MKIKNLLYASLLLLLAGCQIHNAGDKKCDYYFGNTFWGEDYLYCVPFFAKKHNDHEEFLNILLFFNIAESRQSNSLFANSKSDSFYLLLYYQSGEESFKFNHPYRLNPELIKLAASTYAELEKAILENRSNDIKKFAFVLNKTLKSLGITNLQAPTSHMALQLFKSNVQEKLGKIQKSSQNIFFPLYYYNETSPHNSYFSLLYPLTEFKSMSNDTLTIPLTPNNLSPYGKNLAVDSYDYRQILIIYRDEKLVYRKYRNDTDIPTVQNLMTNLRYYINRLYLREANQIRYYRQIPFDSATVSLQQKIAIDLEKLNFEAEIPQNSSDCTKLLEKIISEYSVDITQKSYHLFPFFSITQSEEVFDLELLLFFRYRDNLDSEEWSFLWNFLNYRSSESQKSGHLFFIPFGAKITNK